jgi:hypothetical protein
MPCHDKGGRAPGGAAMLALSRGAVRPPRLYTPALPLGQILLTT